MDVTQAPVPVRKIAWAPIVVTGAVLAIGLVVVGTSTSGGAGMYSYTLAQLGSTDVQGRDIKVTGRVKVGSVRGEPGSPSFRFDLDDGAGHSVPVGYTRLLPDPFQEGRDAIVQGRMDKGVLQASSLTVKCPSRYGDAESMSPQQMQDAYRKHQDAVKKP